MSDRLELLESALDSVPDGLGLLDVDGEVVFWNQAAQGITGYASSDLLGLRMPAGLQSLFVDKLRSEPLRPGPALGENHRSVAQARHKLGHVVSVILHALVLRNGLGERIGSALLFHPVERQDALPSSEAGEPSAVEGARADLLERLQIQFDDFMRGGAPLGVLRLTVDQARELRKTHGAAACQAMIEKVYYALAHGLRPGEEIGDWGQDGFLVIAHERNAEMLAAHSRILAGLARTADFRWWGDRISLTVSIGAAQVAGDAPESLAQLLRRAREAMETSIRQGGNRATTAPAFRSAHPAQEDSPCSPS